MLVKKYICLAINDLLLFANTMNTKYYNQFAAALSPRFRELDLLSRRGTFS